MTGNNNDDQKLRLDKWLWAARFFKTRTLAGRAVKGGHVHINKDRAKSSRYVQVGDQLRITRGETVFSVEVIGLSRFRRPAVEARELYLETEESVRLREEHSQMRKMAYAGQKMPRKKPAKRDRRKIIEFIRKE